MPGGRAATRRFRAGGATAASRCQGPRWGAGRIRGGQGRTPTLSPSRRARGTSHGVALCRPADAVDDTPVPPWCGRPQSAGGARGRGAGSIAWGPGTQQVRRPWRECQTAHCQAKDISSSNHDDKSRTVSPLPCLKVTLVSRSQGMGLIAAAPPTTQDASASGEDLRWSRQTRTASQ